MAPSSLCMGVGPSRVWNPVLPCASTQTGGGRGTHPREVPGRTENILVSAGADALRRRLRDGNVPVDLLFCGDGAACE